MQKKVRVKCELPWSHHRYGWPYCNNALYRHFNNPTGIDLYTNSIIGIIKNSPINRPWIAFIHATNPEIEEIANQDNWKISIKNCLGLYTFSKHAQKLLSRYIRTEITTHPTHIPAITFDFKKYTQMPKVVHIGHWLRKFESFKALHAPCVKTILNCSNLKFNYPDTEVVNYVSEEAYDMTLNSSVVFLDLQDSNANNTVVECIAHNTPLLINRLPALEEYLGRKYPLFFSSVEEAGNMLRDNNRIFEGHVYLKGINKHKFSLDKFIECFGNSEIYKSLPAYKFL